MVLVRVKGMHEAALLLLKAACVAGAGQIQAWMGEEHAEGWPELPKPVSSLELEPWGPPRTYPTMAQRH